MRALTPEVEDALLYFHDQGLTPEVWIAPGVSLCVGTNNAYVTIGEGRAVAVLPLQWLQPAESERELRRRAQLAKPGESYGYSRPETGSMELVRARLRERNP